MRPTSIRPGVSRCPRGRCSAARAVHAPLVETEAGRPQARHRGVGRGTRGGEATSSQGDQAKTTTPRRPLSEHYKESSYLR